MPSKEFTTKQKEIVARRLGYDGPMSMFDEFLKSDPSMAQRYGLVADKYMARGGLAKKTKRKKYFAGGVGDKRIEDDPTSVEASTTQKSATNTTAQQGAATNAGKSIAGTNIALPSNWDSLGGDKKVEFYNQQGVTPAMLAASGVDQATIDYMTRNMGYSVANPTAATNASTNVAAGNSTVNNTASTATNNTAASL